MELGNLIFGHSRGEYPIPRTRQYENPFLELIEAITGEQSIYVPEYENELFVMFPYWLNDCGCGYQEKEDAWHTQNKHARDCFHTRYRQEEERLYDEYPQSDFLVAHNHMTQWAKRNGYPGAPDGMAVHCTCDYSTRWETFVGENQHDPKCGVVRPNFLYKPTGYELRVYKYAMRDAYANQKLTPKQFREMIGVCIGSVKSSVVHM